MWPCARAALAPRRRLRFNAVVSGQSEDGRGFEEKATVRDLSLQGAYLILSNRPKLQSELRVVIEAAAEQSRCEPAIAPRHGDSLQGRAGEQPKRRRNRIHRRS